MSSAPALNLKIPSVLKPLYETDKRYIDLFGGRGGAKSWGVADFLLVKGYESQKRILCTREIQTSIKDSVHKLLSDRIEALGLSSFYTITEKSIKGKNGTEFIFKGLYRNDNDIKSTEGIDFCWCEEAQSISRASLKVLTPTIRKEGSQIIFTYNPNNESDPVHVDYTKADRKDTLKIKINYPDNPFFPDVLRSEMEYMKRVNYEQYMHVWEGECRSVSDACVFKGKFREEAFETPPGVQLYFGADWGFAVDPVAVVRFWLNETATVMYIDYEAGGVGVEIPDTPALFDTIPDVRQHYVIADSARPELISYMNSQGFRIKPAKKGPNSIEEGIEFLKSFEEIIIHPRCKRVLDEFKYYSYKVDKMTGDIQTKLEDKNNHFIDSLRYGTEKMRRKNKYATTARYTKKDVWS
jgi:phage terminase large subunit